MVSWLRLVGLLSTRDTSVNKTDNPHPRGLKATSKSVNLRLQRSMPWGSCHTMVVEERGQFGVDAGEKYPTTTPSLEFHAPIVRPRAGDGQVQSSF